MLTIRRLTQICFLFLFIFLISQDSSAQKSKVQLEFPVTRFVLDNGLTVLLYQNNSAPLVSYHTWYRVGSKNEWPGVTGAAHMLEHMMFKGAKKYSGKEFDQILHENGIVNNAFTSYDYTGFYQTLPSQHLEQMMDMEVDRMRNLAIKAEDLKSELQVVGEERRWRIDNNPFGRLQEAFMGQLFETHPYRWPVIGWMKDIEAYSSEKLRHFYETFYVPNNAVLVLAGDFDTEKTRKMIEKYYGTLQKKTLPAQQFPEEKGPQKVKITQDKSEVAGDSLLVGFLGVAAGTEDSYALDLLAAVLGQGTSSRLHQKLVVQEGVASSTSAWNMSLAHPGSFVLYSQFKPGASSQRATAIFLDEIEKIKKSGVTDRELSRVKNMLMKDSVDSLLTLDGKAQALAVNEILYGDFKRFFGDLEKYENVKKEDLQRVAKKYLLWPNRVESWLKPAKAELNK